MIQGILKDFQDLGLVLIKHNDAEPHRRGQGFDGHEMGSNHKSNYTEDEVVQWIKTIRIHSFLGAATAHIDRREDRQRRSLFLSLIYACFNQTLGPEITTTFIQIDFLYLQF